MQTKTNKSEKHERFFNKCPMSVNVFLLLGLFLVTCNRRNLRLMFLAQSRRVYQCNRRLVIPAQRHRVYLRNLSNLWAVKRAQSLRRSMQQAAVQSCCAAFNAYGCSNGSFPASLRKATGRRACSRMSAPAGRAQKSCGGYCSGEVGRSVRRNVSKRARPLLP